MTANTESRTINSIDQTLDAQILINALAQENADLREQLAALRVTFDQQCLMTASYAKQLAAERREWMLRAAKLAAEEISKYSGNEACALHVSNAITRAAEQIAEGQDFAEQAKAISAANPFPWEQPSAPHAEQTHMNTGIAQTNENSLLFTADGEEIFSFRKDGFYCKGEAISDVGKVYELLTSWINKTSAEPTHVSVPVEPTKEMLTAGWRIQDDDKSHSFPPPVWSSAIRKLWSAMLRAATKGEGND